MIRDVLIPELQKRFPERGLQIDTTSNRIAAFPAALAEVGKVIIYDDGEEATVMIEHITHGHFNPYNPALSQDEVDRQVSEDVTDFLEALFEDKILLWVSPSRHAGGWQRIDSGLAEHPVVPEPGHYYVWSKAIDDVVAFINEIAVSKE